ncbi:acylphosphatase [Microlunatus parietis]|uniref:acylphosphatase n=1 Tax=Microlunatus parietis TaxID=682979 RepID=A0A7Y9I6Q1_9ACTN|nr:acylphosphatase [Microlunatus parietis]NYE71289.1 acylphosphatase [Microlunatus parietis]
MAAIRVRVTGRVQGVGFRYGTADRARALGLTGSAVNRPDGSVDVEAYGDEPAVQRLLDWLRGPGAPGRVRQVEVTRLDDAAAPRTFSIG